MAEKLPIHSVSIILCYIHCTSVNISRLRYFHRHIFCSSPNYSQICQNTNISTQMYQLGYVTKVKKTRRTCKLSTDVCKECQNATISADRFLWHFPPRISMRRMRLSPALVSTKAAVISDKVRTSIPSLPSNSLCSAIIQEGHVFSDERKFSGLLSIVLDIMVNILANSLLRLFCSQIQNKIQFVPFTRNSKVNYVIFHDIL